VLSALLSATAPLWRRNLSAFFLFGAFFSVSFLGPLLMQKGIGYSPIRTGVACLATSAISFFSTTTAGARLVAAVGVRRLLVASFSLIATSALLLTRVPVGGDCVTDLPALLLAGVGRPVSSVSPEGSGVRHHPFADRSGVKAGRDHA
jgi:hypothetical protein